MLERNQERIILDLGNAGQGRIKAEIWRLPRKGSHVCRVTFPDGAQVDSIAERLSWTTVDGAKAWARGIVKARMAWEDA